MSAEASDARWPPDDQAHADGVLSHVWGHGRLGRGGTTRARSHLSGGRATHALRRPPLGHVSGSRRRVLRRLHPRLSRRLAELEDLEPLEQVMREEEPGRRATEIGTDGGDTRWTRPWGWRLGVE